MSSVKINKIRFYKSKIKLEIKNDTVLEILDLDFLNIVDTGKTNKLLSELKSKLI